MSNNETQPDDFGGISIAQEPAPTSEKPEEKQEIPPQPPRARADRPPSGGRGRLLFTSGLLALLAGFLIFLACGYLLIPRLTTTTFAERLGKRLQRPVTIAGAAFDPFTLRLTVQNLIVGPKLSAKDDPVDPFLSVGRASIDFELSGLFSGQTVARAVQAEQLFLHLVRHKDGSYNAGQAMQDLFPDREEPLLYSLNNISVSGSRLTFDDQPTGKTHSVEELNLSVPSLSNIAYQAGQYVKPSFSAKINGSPINLTGETAMTGKTVQASLDLNLKDIDLPRYLDYLPENWRLKIDKGVAEFTGKLVFSQETNAESRLDIEGEGLFRQLTVQGQEGKAHKIEQLSFQGSFSPLKRRYHFQKIALQDLELFPARDKKGAWSFLARPARKNEAPASNGTKESHLRIDQLQVQGGTLHFTDRPRGAELRHSLTDLQLTITGYDDHGASPASFALSAKSGAAARLSAQGSLQASPLQAEGLLVLNQLDLARFSPYLASDQDLRIASGVATSMESRFRWRPAGASSGKSEEFVLSGLKAEIEKLSLTARKEEWLRLPLLRLSEAGLDSRERTLHLGRIKGEKAILLMRWDKDGKANWSRPEKTDSWRLSLTSLEAGQGAIILRSAGIRMPALEQRLEDVTSRIEIGDQENRKGVMSLEATVQGGGALSLEGPIQFAPFNAAFTSRLEKLPLTVLSSLFKGWLRPAITGGELQANGTIRLPEATFTGGVTISDFAAGGKQPLLSWRNAYTENINADLKASWIDLGQLFVEQPVLRWREEPQTTMRSLLFLRQGDQNGPSPVALSVKEISLTKGTVHLSDQRVSPALEAAIQEINGTVSDLANKPENLCRLDLSGIVNNRTPLILSGDFSFFAPSLGADCKIGISGAALTEFSPYLEPVLGYRPAAGTLKLVSLLKKEGNTLSANSQLTINGLRLGQLTDGSRLLPLTLALLADEQQEFSLNISSSGDLASKDFSFGKSIAKHISGLLARTGASPFTVLNESLANGSVPAFLAFKPGETGVEASGAQELASLGEALRKRPGLKLIISGAADDQADRKILFAKLRREEEERRRRAEAQLSQKMAAAYGKEEITKPLSQEQVAPAGEEKSSSEASIRKEELLQLAEERAANIRLYLLEKFKLPAKRLGIASPRILGADSPLAVRSRADFTLDRFNQ